MSNRHFTPSYALCCFLVAQSLLHSRCVEFRSSFIGLMLFVGSQEGLPVHEITQFCLNNVQKFTFGNYRSHQRSFENVLCKLIVFWFWGKWPDLEYTVTAEKFGQLSQNQKQELNASYICYGLPSGVTYRLLDFKPSGHGCHSQLGRCRVTTLGRLFTPMCLLSPSSIIWYFSSSGSVVWLGRQLQVWCRSAMCLRLRDLSHMGSVALRVR